ncbi:hypothetical protein QBC46DRAFT_368856 [Diplogelasinospora grovesii]|uniref:Chromosome transmission fidelity protein 4 n=1 Tax=Diplogelasinospora grovesii TaxID=303347 RepID=A0AAN6NHY6_9PEZI|nr:hypothetical protein QBC46DRAFT_368856 [Diplogelasinospora grovesii]
MSAPIRIRFLRPRARSTVVVARRPSSTITAATARAPAAAAITTPLPPVEPLPLPSSSTPTPTHHLPRNLPEIWFNGNFPLSSSSSTNSRSPTPDPTSNSNKYTRPPGEDEEEDKDRERKVKLGKTLRILQERLPTLLQAPLPLEILSPHISLHLFPSTHPHLPAVTGRVAYMAALWSSPIAWNRVPIIGNVKLEILSERMVNTPLFSTGRKAGAYGEQLVVRWRTIGKAKNWGLPFISTNSMSKSGGSSESGGRGLNNGNDTTESAKGEASGNGKEEFTGLFIFDFDKEGRILSHTIEHVQEGGQWERGVGAKVVGLTDWLLGGMKGGGVTGGREGTDGGPCPAFARKDR